MCECNKAKWVCTENICDVDTDCTENEEFVTCKWDREETCANMHLPFDAPKKPDRCYSGCQCKEGT